jgi:hypothetical protein
MKNFKFLNVILAMFIGLIILTSASPVSFSYSNSNSKSFTYSEENSDIPDLTVPETVPNPNSKIDVFERLAREKAEGYLKVKQEDIGDTYYFTTKQGFDYIHLEGTPSEIGYRHGLLLWEKVERGMASYAYLTESRYGLTWDMCRIHGATFWPNIPSEYQREIDGIVRGCQEKNAKNPDGAVIDRNDIVAYNAMWDIWWRSSYVRSFLPFATLQPDTIHHCSAFVANGDATVNGDFVIAQSLWMPYHLSPSHGVFADVVPESGNRILMELQAGMIWSGTEFYMNGAGLIVGETTLGDAPYQWLNTPAFVRIRKAVQYASSIDEFADIMITNTNGAYCGDYLVADAKTNEVAIVELGSHEYEVWRSDNDFHGSCNYPWDPEVRAEMGEPEGWEHSCFPRYTRLEQIAEKYFGLIDNEIGKRTLGDHWDTVANEENRYHWTLCGHVENSSGYPHGSLDGKVSNRSMVLNHEIWARFGHSCGNNFIASDHAAKNPDYAFPNLRDMIAQPWTTFGFLEPITITVRDKNGDPVEGAEIAFENRADGYLAEGVTDSNGMYHHDYFQTGSYIITAREGKHRGSLHVEFNEVNSLEVVISEQTDADSNSSGAQTAIMVLCVIIIMVVLIAIANKRSKNN